MQYRQWVYQLTPRHPFHTVSRANDGSVKRVVDLKPTDDEYTVGEAKVNNGRVLPYRSSAVETAMGQYQKQPDSL